MQIHIGSKDGPTPSVSGAVEQVSSEIQAKRDEWLDTLVRDPGRLAEVEQEIHLTFGHLADQVVAGVLAEASERPEMQSHQKKRWIRLPGRFGRRKEDGSGS